MNLLFWSLFPDEGLVILLLAAGIAMIIGFRQAATSLICTVVLFAVLGPFVEQFVASLDPLWQLAILALFALAVLRTIVVLLIGKNTAGHLAALLLHDLILLPFRALGVFFRGWR